MESMNFCLKALSKLFHTTGTLWCTRWSLLRVSSIFLTHKSTFSPLISVSANATCQMGDSNPGTPWFSIRYPRNLVRKALALVPSLSKILGRDPMALISRAGGMGT